MKVYEKYLENYFWYFTFEQSDHEHRFLSILYHINANTWSAVEKELNPISRYQFTEGLLKNIQFYRFLYINSTIQIYWGVIYDGDSDNNLNDYYAYIALFNSTDYVYSNVYGGHVSRKSYTINYSGTYIYYL